MLQGSDADLFIFLGFINFIVSPQFEVLNDVLNKILSKHFSSFS